jgi:hypothetical protein
MPPHPPTAALDSHWREMTLPHYLKELRLRLQEAWLSDPSTAKADVEAYEKCRKELEKKGAGANASDAKKFLRDSVGVIIRLLKRENVGKEAGVLGDASQVNLAISNEEALLSLIAPDLSENPSGRWPGPVGYRSALNHLIAVSIRVHSMHPDTKFEVILRASARRIIVPALAHNLTFLRRSAPKAFEYLLKSDEGLERLRGGREIPSLPAGKMPEAEAATAEAWRRLLNAALHFGRQSVVDAGELIAEVKRLTLEHEINPTGSALWNELSLIASGDLSIDELLVSRVTTDLQDKLGAAPPRPIVFCARARFGLLRYSYAMTEEREVVAKEPSKALSTTNDFFQGLREQTKNGGELGEDACVRAFGWAYLWSRCLLLGRAEDKRMDSAEFKASQDKAGLLIEDMLYQVHLHADKVEYRQLALRYVTGFLTNPRFVRPKVLRCKNHEKARSYLQQMREESLPGGLISMMEARLQLHEAYALSGKPGFADALYGALTTYAETLRSISAAEHADNMMDGEVAAWAIPEMRYAVELLKKTVTETGNAKTSKVSELERIQKALDMVGEMQFGVYFNQEEEAGRLEKGLKLGCGDLG